MHRSTSWSLSCRLPRRHVLPAQKRGLASTAWRQGREVRIVEVGPRDGLQNEKTSISVDTKLELIDRLSKTGLRTIEAGAFVSSKWVPQMANSAEILTKFMKQPSQPKPMTYQWLVPNERGLDNFLSAFADPGSAPNTEHDTLKPPRHEISIFASATETFSLKNTNRSIADTLKAFGPLIAKARSHAVPVRAYISVALGCPYEGAHVSPHAVAELATSLLSLGADQISVADTTGMGTPSRTAELLKTLHAAGVRNEDLAMHFHDTYGQALVNTMVSLEQGVSCFDSAVAGLGGCPFSPGATGNVSTEDLVCLLEGLGVKTGVDLEEIARVAEWISRELGRENASRAGKAVLARL